MSVLTRIKNNQITDSTILANTKIVPGSIVGSLFSSNLTMTSDVTITGNLTVQGASTYLTIASTNTYVNDPLIVLNNAYSGSNPYDLGFVFNRGTELNQALVWNEYNKEFRLVGTTETGTTYGNINQTNFANLHVGNATIAWTGDFGNAITSPSTSFSLLDETVTDLYFARAATTITMGTALGATTLNGSLSAGLTELAALNNTPIGNATPSTGVFTTATAGAVNSGFIGNTGTAFSGASLNLSGNVLTAGIIANDLTVNGDVSGGLADFASINNTPIGNATPAAGTFTTATAGSVSSGFVGNTGTQFTGASINLSGNVLASSVLATYVSADDVVAGNVDAGFIGNTGTVFSGASINLSGNVLTAGVVANELTVNGDVSAGLTELAALNNTPIGNATPAAGDFTNVGADNLYLSGLTATRVPFANAAGYIVDDANLTFESVDNILTIDGIAIDGANATIITTGTDANLVLAPNGVGYVDVNSTNIINVADPVDNQDAATKAYVDSQISSGGSVISQDDSDVTVLDDGIDPGIITSNVDGVRVMTSLTNEISFFGNGAVGESQLFIDNDNSNVVVNATLYVSTSANVESLYAGSLVTEGQTDLNLTTAVALNNTPIGNATPSTGVFTTVTAGSVSSGFIGNTGTAFSGASLNVSGNVLAAGGVYTDLETNGTLYANASTASTDLDTGALIVAGGAAVSGNLNVGGNLLVNDNVTLNEDLTVSSSGITRFQNTTNATGADSGAVRIAGGASIEKDLHVIGNLYVSNIFATTYDILTIQDPLLYLTANNTYPYNYDIGFYSQFVGPDPITGTGNVYQHVGVVRDNADYTWKFFSNVRDEPTGATLPFDSDTIFDPVLAGNLTLTYTQAAISTTTGAFKVAGGAGVGGRLYAGLGIQDTVIGNVTPAAAYFTTLNATGNVLLGLTEASAINATPIGNATPSTGAFTTLTASSVSSAFIGNTGTAFTGASLNVSGNVLASSAILTYVSADDVVAGNVDAGFVGNTGTQYTGASINVSGNVLASSAILTYVSADDVVAGNVDAGFVGNTGTQYTGASLNVSGNVLASSAILTYVSADDVVAGNVAARFIGNTGTAYIGATINLSANILAAGAVFNDLSVNGDIDGGLAVFASINNTPIGNATPSTGVFTTATAGAVNSGFIGNTGTQFTGATLNASGNVLASAVLATYVSADDVVAGNVDAGFVGNTGTQFTGASINLSANILAAGAILNDLTVNGDVSGGLADFAAINNTPIGNATASTGAFTTLTASQIVYANASAISTNYNTGALRVPNGGIGSAGNISIKGGSQLLVGSDLTGANITANASAHVFGDVNGVGPQLLLQNVNHGNVSSTDIIIGSDETNGLFGPYLNLGITSSIHNDPLFQMAGPNDTYLYSQGNGSNGGNLLISTGQARSDIQMHLGAVDGSGLVATFSEEYQHLKINSTTQSTDTASGALVVQGGVGIGGNVWVANGVVINNSQTADDFVVKGAVTTSLIYAHSNQGVVTIGGSNVTPSSGATLWIEGSDAVRIPVGSNAERPGSTGNTDVTGMLRFNTTINNLEWYDGTEWSVPGSSATTVITSEEFTGNGVQDTFTLANASSTNSCIVSINGVIQIPVTAYGISGTTLTFTEAPADGDTINVRKLTTLQQITSLSSGNGYMSFDVGDISGTYANITGGFSSATSRVSVNAEGLVSLVNDAKLVGRGSAVAISANATPYVIDSFTQTRYTSAKYLVSVKRGATEMQTMEAVLVTDQSGNAYISTYGVINTGTDMGVLTANVLAGNVQVYFTTNTNMVLANVRTLTTYVQ